MTRRTPTALRKHRLVQLGGQTDLAEPKPATEAAAAEKGTLGQQIGDGQVMPEATIHGAPLDIFSSVDLSRFNSAVASKEVR